MAKKNRDYWIKRAESRLVESELMGKQAIARTLDIYEEAQRKIDNRIRSIYDNYSKKGVVDVKLLKEALTPKGQQTFLSKIRANATKLGLDVDKVYDERYLARLSNLDALKQQIALEIMAIAPTEENITRKSYSDILQNSYALNQQDLKAQGIVPSFGTLDKRTMDQILRAQWFGRNFSSSVWNNVGTLASELPNILGAGIASGESYQKTARVLRERFDVGKVESVRLVRTETNFFHNQAELQSYVDDGITRYQFEAFIDKKTSKACRNHDGKEYLVSDAKVGINYPPLHPNCRSTTTPLFDGELARKPKTTRKRVERFATFDNGSTQEKWKAAMLKQMNPNKATRDYNAELNILTQNYKGGELVGKIDELMSRIPADYPLRAGLERMAKIDGWDGDKNVLAVRDMLREADIDPVGIRTTPSQAEFITNAGIKFKELEGEDSSGIFNPNTNELGLDSAIIEVQSDYLNNPGFKNRTFQHELGHAVDSFAPLFEPKFGGNFSDSDGTFNQIILTQDGKAPSLEAVAVSKYRISTGLKEDIRKQVESIPLEEFSNVVKTQSIPQLDIEIPKAVIDYYLDRHELFAEAYSIYHTNPKYLQDNAPRMYDYISKVSKLSL